MSDESTESIPRRDFVSQAALSALVLGAACTPGTMAPAATPRPAAGGTASQWDDSWFGRLTAPHKAVFEQPEIDYGSVTSYASRYLNGMRDAIGDQNAQVVLVIRHNAIPLALNDAMWEKYGIGEERKLKMGESFATRNPIAVRRSTNPPTGRAESNLAWFASNGHILLGCNVALTGYAGIIAQRAKADGPQVLEELKANLVPGMIMQPNGIYATLRAQEAGCTYIRCP